MRLRQKDGLWRDRRHLDRDGPTDGIDLHHLEKKTRGSENGTEAGVEKR